MKLITAFGLVSALLLLSVSTILVVKQNRADDLTTEDFECLGVTYGYNPNFYVPYLAYFSNTCKQPKEFFIVYELYSQQTQYETGCLSQNDQERITIHARNITINSVKSRNC